MGSALLISLVLVWSSSLQLKTMLASGEVGRFERQVLASAEKYRLVLDNQRRIQEIQGRIDALKQLATNRFLHATLLNGLQQTTANDVELVRLRVEQKFTFVDAIKPTTNANRAVVAGRPPSCVESAVLILDARDSGPDPGDGVQKFKRAISSGQYFQNAMGKTNEFRLTSLSPPQVGPGSLPFVSFTLEGRFPEKSR